VSKRRHNKRPHATRRRPASRARNPRGDGFTNALTGLGTAGYDRRLATTFGVGLELALNPYLIRDLMRGDAIARKVVAKQVDMAFAGGVEWRAISPAGDDLKAPLLAELTRLKALARIKSARIWGRAFGLAILVINADDGGAPEEPLNLALLNRITHLRKVDKPRIVKIELDTSGGDRDGEAEYYTIQTAGGMPLRIHHTRVIRFDGLEVDEDTFERLNYSHDTVLQPVWEVLKDHQTGGSVLSAQLEDSIKVIWKIRGLHDAIAAGDAGFVQNWMQSMSMFTSAFRAMGIDSEGEDVSFLTKPLKESVDVFMALMHRVSAAADLPLVELFGMAPSGLSTDDKSGTRRYYDKIRSEEQEGALKAALDRLVEVITAQRTSPLEGALISYTWPSLWSPTAAEVAALNKQTAETHAIMVGLGAWAPAAAADALAPAMGVEVMIPTEEAPE